MSPLRSQIVTEQSYHCLDRTNEHKAQELLMNHLGSGSQLKEFSCRRVQLHSLHQSVYIDMTRHYNISAHHDRFPNEIAGHSYLHIM